MATEHEIERLLVRLIGDSKQYQQMLNEAQTSTREAAREVEKAGGEIEKTKEVLKDFGESALVVGGAMTAVGTAVGALAGSFARGTIQAYGVQEKAELRLRAAIAATGREVDGAMERYKQFASELQNATVYGDEGTLAFLQQAESLGLHGRQAERAVKNALALSTATGRSTRRMLLMTAALEQGEVAALKRFIPALQQIEDQTEAVATAQRELSKMFAVAEAEGDSFTGGAQQLSNAWGDLQEKIGGMLSVALRPLMDGLGKVVASLDEAGPLVHGMIAAVTGLLTAVAGLTTAVGGWIAGLWAVRKAVLGVTAAKTKLLAVSKAVYATMLANPLIAVGAAITGITYAVVRSTSMLAEFNAEQERAKQIADEWSGRQQQATDIVLEQFNRMGREAGMAFLQEELSKLQEQWDTLAAQVNSSADAIEEAQNSWRHFFVGGVTNEVEAMRTEHEALVQRLDDVGEAAERIGDALSKAQRASSIDAMTADLTLLNEGLRHQIETWGMTEAEIARVKFAQAENTEELERYIAGLEKVEALKAADRQKEAAEREIDRQAEAVEKLVEGLEKQAETFGMSDRELALYEAHLNGATEEQLRYIDALTKQVAQQTEFNDLQEEAARLVEDMQTPLERFAQQQQRYFKMLNAGLIDLDTYNAALKEARAVASEAFKIDFDVRGVEAVEWGSAAMHDLMAEYEMGLQRPELPNIPKPEVSKEAQAIIDAQLHKDDRHEKTVEEILNKIFKSLDDRDALMIEAANLSNKS